MTQISRPFQIALVTMGLFVAVWLVALRGHSAGTGNSGSAAPAPTTSSAASGPGAPSSVYHGPAPGVEGLTRAISKAHATVAESERGAKQLQEKSAQAATPSSAAAVAGTAAAGATAAGSAASTAGPAASKAGPGASAAGPWTSSWVQAHRSSARGTSAARSSAAARSRSGTRRAPATRASGARQSTGVAVSTTQVSIERELGQGKLVAILFWNPAAPVDQRVHAELQEIGHDVGQGVVIHVARASQVGSFGSLLRAAPVEQTPTILVVNKRGLTLTLTGLTDGFAIQQAISEARQS